MRSVNKVVLIWNLTKDPEIKTTSTGHSFCIFTIATNRDWTSAEWEKQSTTEFHKVAAWGKLANLCWDFLVKWKLVYIEWYLKTRTWEFEEKKYSKTEIIAQDMIMLNKKWETTWASEKKDNSSEPSTQETSSFSDDVVDIDWHSI